jgi:ADP-dependent NAD(P)H-hydrate dehydratase / NAD(P)H-hydrate epimerase
MREIDALSTERHNVPSLELMENAGLATARVVEELIGGASGKRILVLSGKGNNGGDGAVTARLLANGGAMVQVILFGLVEATKGEAKINFEKLKSWNEERAIREQREVPEGLKPIDFFCCDSEKAWAQLSATVLSAPHDAIVDALFGTGLTRPVAGLELEAIRYLLSVRQHGDARPKIVSIDVPSGLNSDLGESAGEAVIADATVTMTAPKPANVLPPSAHHNGRLIVADIGSPASLIEAANSNLLLTEDADARRWLAQTRYTPASYKNTHGHVLVVGGSRGFTGAAALCANGAMRAGAGLVTVATSASAQPLVAAQVMPEVMTTSLAETDRGAVSDEAVDYFLKFSERANVVAIGPGLSAEDDRTRAFVRSVVEERTTPIVIDADGLNCLSPWPSNLRGSAELPIVLTPHPGEMRRLLGAKSETGSSDRVATARDFATRHQVILLLKGGRSLIAAPDGRVFLNSTGNAGLGTAGAGDTLTGVVASFIAQAKSMRIDALESVIAALYIAGLAGDLAARELGMRAMVASDIREHLSAAIRSLDPEGERPA